VSIRTLTAVALACSVMITACGSSSSPSGSPTAQGKTFLNTKRVAAAITASILSERAIHASVVCPPRVPQVKGLKFSCVASTYATAHGHRKLVHTVFTVFQKDNDGNVYYESPK